MSAGASILIVDDEARNRKLLAVLLKPEGYLTVQAASGEEALAAIARQAPDLVLLDIMMPGMDGYEVAKTLKASPDTAGIPIIMVTAQIDRETRLRGLDAGAEEFLTKPVDRAELWLRVRNLLRLKAYSDLLRDYRSELEAEVRARTAELQRFRTAMDSTADAILLADRGSMRFVEANATAASMLGYSREELLRIGPAQVAVPVAIGDLERDCAALVSGGKGEQGLLTQVRRKDGSRFPAEVRRSAHRAGEDWIIVEVVRDVSERNTAQDLIARLNRVHVLLSSINGLIIRASDRDQLFRETCRIAIEAGGFHLALVGLVEPGVQAIALVASAGSGEEHQTALQSMDTARSVAGFRNSLMQRAIASGQAVVINDWQHDPLLLSDENFAGPGLQSAAALPLVVGGEAIGALALYAGSPGFFGHDEVKLLSELVADIAFAIDRFNKQERLDYLACYDVLTGLANRALFLDRVTQYLRIASGSTHKLAVLILDVERFKNINDGLGQPAGDSLLRQVAHWLIENLGDANLVARLGSDLFAVVLTDIRLEGRLAGRLEHMLGAFEEHSFQLGDASFQLTLKMGVSVFPIDGASADTLLSEAESALKQAKASGRSYLFYNPQMTASVARRLSLENRLRHALDQGEFVLHYQPKGSLETGKVEGVEALIRWNDPQAGLVPPGEFIPILEETGLIHPVGRWVMRQAIDDYLRWRAAGLAAVPIAVNVSALQLRSRGFMTDVQQAIGVHALAAEGLELELTESLLMEDVEYSIACLQAIRGLGIGIAIDDFGTGFSSLSYLSKLPLDTLKIDRSFVLGMTSGAPGLALLSTIVQLGRALKLKVVAEGVESEEQLRLLRLLGCDQVQGFAFSHALTTSELEARFLSAAPVVASPDAPGLGHTGA